MALCTGSLILGFCPGLPWKGDVGITQRWGGGWWSAGGSGGRGPPFTPPPSARGWVGAGVSGHSSGPEAAWHWESWFFPMPSAASTVSHSRFQTQLSPPPRDPCPPGPSSLWVLRAHSAELTATQLFRGGQRRRSPRQTQRLHDPPGVPSPGP